MNGDTLRTTPLPWEAWSLNRVARAALCARHRCWITSSNERRHLAHHAPALGGVVQCRVSEVEGHPHELEEFSDLLVHLDGLLRQPVVRGVVTARPLQEVLLCHARHGQDENQEVEEPQALRLDELHDGVPGEARGNPGLHAREDPDKQAKEHGESSLLVHLEQALLHQALGVRRRIRRCERPENARGHKQVHVPQQPAVGEHRQRFPVLPRAVHVRRDEADPHIHGLILQVQHHVGGRLPLGAHDPGAAGRSRVRGPVRGLRGDDVTDEHVLLAPHARL
eukprot:CAMPEP_0170278226 /NCGR_PEP_ID=MMETSP0116_2-20130129/39115_1 /TAXON_ID=400756 /ORGANISM="Durinskia baltica, Strain CSIRO CS-38" /LENGTH=279 /DNA_ID=CAMNT_0010529533 /DNA_START=139 /DNA_END=975 /DNA_ORIENTATION=+